jgi:1-acyl-sn-glycerol-3-phosphate acyltransferase
MFKAVLWLKSLLFYLLMTVTAIIYSTLLTLLWPLPFALKSRISRQWSKLNLRFGQVICGLDYQILGGEHLNSAPAVFMCKHESAWETIAFNGILPPGCFVLKKSLLLIPFFGWGMKLTRHIPIDRSKGIRAFKEVIKIGQERLNQGLSIIIFPEGTRVAPRSHPEFLKSGAALAKATGYPIIPVAHNAGLCWRKNSFIKYPGLITIVIGPPITTKDYTIDQINEMTHAWVKAQMEQIEP